MRALHLISSPERRGAQLFALQLTEAIAEGTEAVVLALSATSQPDPLGVEVLARRRWDPRGLLQLISMARNFDVIIGHGSSTLIHGGFVAARSNRPFIYRNIGDPAAWSDIRFADARIGRWMRSASAVVSLYPTAAEYLIKTYRIPSDRVEVIPNAVPHTRAPVPTDKPAAREQLGLDPCRPWVLLLGALTEEKQPGIAIRAVASLPDVGMVIAGSGPEEADCRRLAAELAPGRIRFLGVISTPEHALAASDVLVLPSRTEGVPAAAIEAGLAGLPVVASAVGGVRSIVIDGETGILVNEPIPALFAEAIMKALDHQGPLGTAAIQRCMNQFTFDSVAPLWASLIDRVATGFGPPFRS